jgi:ribosomal protein S18 acetylase RimI-like enzyme
MEHKVNIVTVSAQEMSRAIAVLTAGFISDPFNRWIYPGARDYLESFPAMVGFFAAPGCEDGTFFAVEDLGAAAAWLLPGRAPGEGTVDKHFEKTVRSEILDDLFRAFEQMDAYHHEAEPCWYLPAIAADASRQGRGLGSALMKHALELCDREGAQAYLETANPANISLYEPHGFEVVGRIDVGSAPPIRPMIRPAR